MVAAGIPAYVAGGLNGFARFVFRRQTGQWSGRIKEIETTQCWYPEGRHSDQRDAQAAAFQALQRITSEDRPVPAA
jgi:hypothetical protein